MNRGDFRQGRRLAMIALASAAVSVGAFTLDAVAHSQDNPAPAAKADDSSIDTKKRKTGGLRVPVGRIPKSRRQAAADPLKQAEHPAEKDANADPNAKAADPAKAKGGAAKKAADPAAVAPNQPQHPIWPFHYTLKIAGADGSPLSAAYYPAKTSLEAPVVILLHEIGSGRAAKDFEQPIDELKGASFARHMQAAGFAVLVLNPRAPSGNNRNAQLSSQDYRLMVTDLQNAYRFLVDRHNRGELNLAKLAVIALGDAANLAVAWAGSDGGGVSNEGRLSDLGAVVLISPLSEIPGRPLARDLPAIATRFPLLAMTGDRDAASIQVVRDNQRIIERHRLSRAAYYDTTLHAGKLLTFFPKLSTVVERFLDDPVKNRKVEWEPRFLLDPVPYDEIQLVPDSGFAPFQQQRNPAPPARNAQPKEAGKKAAAKNQ